MMAVAIAGFTACSDDKDGDGKGITGRWEATTDHELINDEWVLTDTYSAGQWEWEFTDGKLNEYWEGELEYSYSYSYSSKKKELTIAGIVAEVETLNATTLVVIQKSWDVDLETYKTTFVRK